MKTHTLPHRYVYVVLVYTLLQEREHCPLSSVLMLLLAVSSAMSGCRHAVTGVARRCFSGTPASASAAAAAVEPIKGKGT